MKRWIIRSVVAGVGLCLCAVCLFACVSLIRIECVRGSVLSRLVITSPVIKHFPVIKPLGDGVLTRRPMDGASPEAQCLTYTSSENLKVLEAVVDSYLKSKGYHRDSGDDSRAEWVGPDGTVDMRLRHVPDGTEVCVTQWVQ